MRFNRKCIAFLFAFLFIPVIAAAATMYVSDQLVITVRQDESLDSQVLKTIRTGTPVEVLERNKGDKFVKVRLASGEEGYVLGQYLTSKTPKSTIIADLQGQLGKIQDQLAQTKAKLAESSQKLKAVQDTQKQQGAELSGKVSELTQALAEAKGKLRTVSGEYADLQKKSGKVIEITKDRDRLKKANAKLGTEIRALSMENTNLKRAGGIKWFLAGAGVLFMGWIIGKASRKKKSMF